MTLGPYTLHDYCSRVRSSASTGTLDLTGVPVKRLPAAALHVDVLHTLLLADSLIEVSSACHTSFFFCFPRKLFLTSFPKLWNCANQVLPSTLISCTRLTAISTATPRPAGYKCEEMCQCVCVCVCVTSQPADQRLTMWRAIARPCRGV